MQLSNATDQQNKLVFIGDIHGQYKKLKTLLHTINFNKDDPKSLAADHKLVFIGDLIDNAPQTDTDHIALLTMVKSLVDEGFAYCLLGNHEFNAIGWATKHSESQQWLRPHNENNTKQHQGFLNDVVEGSDEHLYWITWFKSLPLYLDFGKARAIHACWEPTAIAELGQYINQKQQLLATHWQAAFDKTTALYQLIEMLLKGPEISLPSGYSFADKTNTLRTQIRSKWWLKHAKTYRDIAQVQPEVINNIPDLALPAGMNYSQEDVPVFIGHYTLSDYPSALSRTVVCVDFNAAKGSNPLVAYQWQAGNSITDQYFMFENKLTSESLKNIWCMQTINNPNDEWFDDYLQENTSSDAINRINAMPQEETDFDTDEIDELDNQIDEILWQHWDPIHVNGMEECRDEYSAFSWGLTKVALYNKVETVAAELYYLEEYYLRTPNSDVVSRAMNVASLIMKLVKDMGLSKIN
jgi:hypothetical protein